MTASKGKALVGISGGVDSAVAAALLTQAGYEVTGVFLDMAGDTQLTPDSVPSARNISDAQRVASIIGIELLTLSAADELEPIIQDFASQYALGRTPNPCINCNAKVKFPLMLKLADSLSVRYVATGHYARIANRASQTCILRGKDPAKDQSYALFSVPAEHLSRVLLPIGELSGKDEVRSLAEKMRLPVAAKPDSQEICFAPGDDYVAILQDRAGHALRTGRIVTADGQTIGTHNGYARFTIGQRRGLGISAKTPLYVTAIDPEAATVTVGPIEKLAGMSLTASQTNWHCDVPDQFEAIVQIRYNHRGATAAVTVGRAGGFRADFQAPVNAITPGQAAVVYDGDRLLGGGWIES